MGRRFSSRGTRYSLSVCSDLLEAFASSVSLHDVEVVDNNLASGEFVRLLLSSLSADGGILKRTVSNGSDFFVTANHHSTVEFAGLTIEELHVHFV